MLFRPQSWGNQGIRLTNHSTYPSTLPLPLPLVVCAGGTEYCLTEHRLAEEGVQISRGLFRPFYGEGTKDLMWFEDILKENRVLDEAESRF